MMLTDELRNVQEESAKKDKLLATKDDIIRALQQELATFRPPPASDSEFDIEEQDRFLEEQANLQKEKEEQQKTLARMVKALVPPPVEEDALVDEEIHGLNYAHLI